MVGGSGISASNDGTARRDEQHVASAPAEAKREPPRPAGLLADIADLPGIGPRRAQLLARLTGRPVERMRRIDLLWHLPRGIVAQQVRTGIAGAEPGQRVVLDVIVRTHQAGFRLRQPHRIVCWAGDRFLHLVFFQGRETTLRTRFPENQRRRVSGVLSRFGVEWQIVHPDLETGPLPAAGGDGATTVRPSYPLAEGISALALRKVMALALDELPEVPEWHDPARLEANGWPPFADALRQLHAPATASDLLSGSPAWRRLAFDELVAHQLAMALRRRDVRAVPARPFAVPHDLRATVLRALPFALTSGQSRALAEIDADLGRPERMLRLLQGDVGSGKTLVALLAMLSAVAGDTQAVIMAPTELLARQHSQRLHDLLAPAQMTPVLLVGSERAPARRAALRAIATGAARIIVGTHALFQEEVVFHRLGLAIIDEQHRFGVEQRLALMDKTDLGHLLVMTATPIPRTLVLSLYGDMAVSELREKPPGRQPVVTRALPVSRLDEVIRATGRIIGSGQQLYWVCPAIESQPDEPGDSATAIGRFEDLDRHFPGQVGLVHGRQPAAERASTMAAFAAGKLRILVATTVIEVGVDVPAAGAMVIEEAERFGLAQLHQLRGRVGRGSGRASCLLLHGGQLGVTARRRLDVLRKSDDGFAIGEEDLRLRGPGEVLGVRQSGLPAYRLADLEAHADLLAAARDEVEVVLRSDPRLAGPRGRALRFLLRLFERDAALAYLASG